MQSVKKYCMHIQHLTYDAFPLHGIARDSSLLAGFPLCMVPIT